MLKFLGEISLLESYFPCGVVCLRKVFFTLKVSFMLVGMSTFGYVQDIYGNVLSNAEVFLNNNSIGRTNDQGRYDIALLKEGTKNSLTAKVENLYFEVHFFAFFFRTLTRFF